MMTWLAGLPAFLRFLVYVVVAAIVVILLALGVNKAGGFNESLQLGHFHLDIGTGASTATVGNTGNPGTPADTGPGNGHGHGHGHGPGHGPGGQGDS